MTTPENSPLRGVYTPLAPRDALAIWMAAREMSETDVATATGLPVNLVTRLLRGTQPITDAIAKALAVPTGNPAEEWLALQARHTEITATATATLAALDHGQPSALPARRPRLAHDRRWPQPGPVTKGFGYVQFTDDDQDQEPDMMMQPSTGPERQIPLHSSATLHSLADLWRGQIELTEGPQSTAVVLAQLSAIMKAAGIGYLNSADLETLSAAVRPSAETPAAKGS